MMKPIHAGKVKEAAYDTVLSFPARTPPPRRVKAEVSQWRNPPQEISVGPDYMPSEIIWTAREDTPQYKADKRAAQRQHAISDAHLRELEAQLGPLDPWPNGRGKFLLTFPVHDSDLGPIYRDHGFERDETPTAALARKKEEYFGARWYQPEAKDFYGIDTLGASVVVPFGCIPLSVLDKHSGIFAKGRIPPLRLKFRGLPSGVVGLAFIRQFSTTLGKLGKEMLSQGITSPLQILEILYARQSTGVVTADKRQAQRFFNAALLNRLELKRDILIPQELAYMLDVLAAMPFAFPRTKYMDKKTSKRDPEDRTVWANKCGKRRTSRGEIHIPRCGVVFYTIMACKVPGMVSVRLEVRRSGQARILSLFDTACPLPTGKSWGRIYVEDALIPGVPTAIFNAVLDEIIERVLGVGSRKPSANSGWYRTTDLRLPAELTPEGLTAFSRMFFKTWEAEEAVAKKMRATKGSAKASKHLCLRRLHYLRKFVILLRERDVDLVGFLRRFRPDAQDGCRNGYFQMRPAAEVAAENTGKYPAYLAQQNIAQYRNTGNWEPEASDNSTYPTFPNPNTPNPTSPTHAGSAADERSGSGKPVARVVRLKPGVTIDDYPVKTPGKDGEEAKRKGPKAHRTGEAGGGTDPGVSHPGKPHASGRSPRAKGDTPWLGLWGQGSQPGEG